MKEPKEGIVRDFHFDVLDSNLIAYYPMQQGRGSTLIDRSSKGKNGTITGATWKRLPRGIWVLSFDGNDKVESAAITIAGAAISLECWLYLDALAASKGIIGYSPVDTTTNGAELYTLATGELRFRCRSSAGAKDSMWDTPAGTVTTETWYRILVTQAASASAPIVYVNNVSQTITTVQSESPARVTGSFVLAYSYIQGGYITGRLALPRLYQDVVTSAEDTQHYTRERLLFGV